MVKRKIYKDYTEFLHEQLQDPKFVTAYLNEALHDEDRNVFLLALKDVIDAQDKDISELAEEAHISRQSCYRMLSRTGNPRWNNITSLMGAMGLQIEISRK